MSTKEIATWLMFSAHLAAGAGIESDLRIAVRVHNQAQLPKHTLFEAELVAGGMFQKAGIAPEWLDCNPTSLQSGSYPCEGPVGPGELFVQVLPGKGMKHFGFEHTTLGFAVVPVEDAFGTDAFICYSCVKDLATAIGGEFGEQSTTSVILGSVIAHELAHLLGVRNHSLFGIMHVPWTRGELALARQNRLLFLDEEQHALQAQIRMRTAEASRLHAYEVVMHADATWE